MKLNQTKEWYKKSAEIEGDSEIGAGVLPTLLPKQYTGPFYGCKMGKIFIKTKCGDTGVLDVRGWGYLTGKGGGLGLNEEDAAQIQDQFEQWVIAALNHYSESE